MLDTCGQEVEPMSVLLTRLVNMNGFTRVGFTTKHLEKGSRVNERECSVACNTKTVKSVLPRLENLFKLPEAFPVGLKRHGLIAYFKTLLQEIRTVTSCVASDRRDRTGTKERLEKADWPRQTSDYDHFLFCPCEGSGERQNGWD